MIGGPPSRVGTYAPAACTGKQRFANASLAHRVVKRSKASKRRRDKLRGAMTAYHCKHCGGYHIGGAT